MKFQLLIATGAGLHDLMSFGQDGKFCTTCTATLDKA